MTIALASPRVASSTEDALTRVERGVAEAAERGARVVCFPEAYVPGLRGVGLDVPVFDAADQARVLDAVGGWARTHGIAVVLGMEWFGEAGRHIAAAVIDPSGACLARLPYGQEGVLVAALDLDAATGLLAHRLVPERYPACRQRWLRSRRRGSPAPAG